MKKLVVIGAGMASGRMLEYLTQESADFEITVFNAEPRGTYNRIMLSPVLAGEKTLTEIITHSTDWYEARGIACRFGERVVSIDTVKKQVMGEKGAVSYDKLVIATGSSSFILPIKGSHLEGVIGYRDVEDTLHMIETAKGPSAKVVVIGGGVLGLEAAAGLKSHGADVTVLHNTPFLMNRQLDQKAAGLLQSEIEARGIRVICDAKTEEILGVDGRVSALRIEGYPEISCDLVVMAAGIRPNVQLARDAGLDVNRAITVNRAMKTSDPDVFALGECVECEGELFGLVAPLFDQARVVADTLQGKLAHFESKDIITKLKVTGCNLFSAGDFVGDEFTQSIVFDDPMNTAYRKVVLRDDRVVGAILYGETNDGTWFYDLIQKQVNVSEIRDTLLFGPAYQDKDILALAGVEEIEPLRATA